MEGPIVLNVANFKRIQISAFVYRTMEISHYEFDTPAGLTTHKLSINSHGYYAR